jgi:hypothetical protein
MNWHKREAAERFAERRRREDEAPRLLTVIPKLESLKFKIEEYRSGGSLPEAAHVRPIILARAPALFFFACQDSSCRDGGHDVTVEVTSSLRRGETEFRGEDACRGQTGAATCSRILRFTATATYKP